MKKKPKAIKASNTILGKDSNFEGNMKSFGTITVGGGLLKEIFFHSNSLLSGIWKFSSSLW